MLYLALFMIIFVIYRKFKDTKIDFKSFLKKQPVPINDDFGVNLITGYQGTGKTYLAVYMILYLISKEKIIYTNIHSLKIPNRKIKYFTKLDEITDNIEENRVFIIDEISKRFTKECKQDKKFYSWLQQSRKRKRIVLLITQEYLQVPQWLRGVARYVYTTYSIINKNICCTLRGYAVLDEEKKEWTVLPDKKYIYKRNQIITDLFDTLEPINIL